MQHRLHIFIAQSSRMLLPLLAVGLLLVCASGAALGSPAVVHAAPANGQIVQPMPLLAYYYIWFDPKSWNRAKTDLPQLGPYSSDDRSVMQQHIRWAKQAGITGFIVSWKSTETLNRRLEQLIAVANEEQFKLVIIYQGLDFNRNPLPADRIAADLDYFIQHYSDNPVFSLFERPVVIWSGTWKFSRDDVARVTATRRTHLLMLASEKNVDAYQRLADVVDGDAYYWSSVNPETFPSYEEKLNTMAQAIHANRGLWFAPAAAGFDARLVGGTTIVDRHDGATLRRQMDAAINSSPDAIGLISWNEFSENSYVEPSQQYGQRYLHVLAELQGVAPLQTNGDLDSSSPGDTQIRPAAVAPIAALGVLFLASVGIIIRRAWRKR